MDNNSVLQVKARDRERLAFEGPAVSVSSINDRGVFDILPNHANFISLVRNYLKIKKPDGKITELKLAGPTVLRVYKNQVSVYLGLGSTETI